MPIDPCKGCASEEECAACRANQYMNGYAQEKLAVEGELKAGRIDKLTADMILHALDVADGIWTKAIKKHAGG